MSTFNMNEYPGSTLENTPAGGGGGGGGGDKLEKPGELVIETLNLKPLSGGEETDIIKITNEVNVYEDLFLPFTVGDVIITDTTGLIDSLPITQQEEIKIEWKTPSMDAIKKKYIVYKISNRVPGRYASYSFVLHFVTAEAIKNSNTRVSKSYKDMTIKDIVTDIFDEYLKVDGELEWEHDPTNEEEFSCVIPNWRPLAAINWVLERAYLDSPQNANFRFYESLDGEETPKFKIACISQLIQEESEEEQKFSYSPSTIPGSKEYENSKDPVKQLMNVSQYSIMDTDKLVLLKRGVFFSRVIDHDIVRKTIRTTDFKYTEKFDEAKHMFTGKLLEEGDKGLSEDKEDPKPGTGLPSVTRLVSKHKYLFSKEEDDEGQDRIGGDDVDWLLPSRSRKNDIHTYQVNIEAPGDSRRRVSKMVEFSIPMLDAQQTQTMANSSGSARDPMSDGKYLLASVRHRMSPHAPTIGSAYQQLMTLKRDSIKEAYMTSGGQDEQSIIEGDDPMSDSFGETAFA